MTRKMLGDRIMWETADEIPSELLKHALAFYERSPDGQYDQDVVVPLLEKEIKSREDTSEKRIYSICPRTETGMHEWERLPIVVGGVTLDPTDAWTAMNVVTLSDMKCTQCGQLYSEHVTVENSRGP